VKTARIRGRGLRHLEYK